MLLSASCPGLPSLGRPSRSLLTVLFFPIWISRKGPLLMGMRCLSSLSVASWTRASESPLRPTHCGFSTGNPTYFFFLKLILGLHWAVKPWVISACFHEIESGSNRCHIEWDCWEAMSTLRVFGSFLLLPVLWHSYSFLLRKFICPIQEALIFSGIWQCLVSFLKSLFQLACISIGVVWVLIRQEGIFCRAPWTSLTDHAAWKSPHALPCQTSKPKSSFALLFTCSMSLLSRELPCL